ANRTVVQSRPVRTMNNSNFYYEVIDTLNKELNVNFKNVPVENIINEIGYDLKIDVYTASPLENAGNVSFKAKKISFDELLNKIFESAQVNTPTQPNPGNQPQGQNVPQQNPMSAGSNYTYKKEGNIYFFDTENQLNVRIMEVVTLKHRSIEILGDPTSSGGSSARMNAGLGGGGFQNYFGGNNGMMGNYGGGMNNQFNAGNTMGTNYNNFNNSRQSLNTNSGSDFTSDDSKLQAIVDIIPDEVKVGLDIKVDRELNSFFVSGSSMQVERFKTIIDKIDKPVPVVLIEVMFLEVGRNSTVETGISWGIGDEPVKTQGAIFPSTDFTL